MTVEKASPYLAGFFFVLGLSRALCFWRLDESRERTTLVVTLLLAPAAFLLGHEVNPLFFPLAGILGPFFPIFMARASRRFPTYSKQITQHLLLAMQATLAIGHFAVGGAADRFGIDATYYGPAVLMVFVLLGFASLERRSVAVHRPLVPTS